MVAGSGMVFAIDDRRRRLDGKPVAPSVVVSSHGCESAIKAASL
jgi:hypothetical protein